MHDDPTVSLDDEWHGPDHGPDDVPVARDTWGGFRLLARVGSGGFGEVYRAWDPSLEREVALKLLLSGRAERKSEKSEIEREAENKKENDKEYKAILREARVLASIRHPNIVHVYGVDRHDGRVGFWTDFVQGKTLSVLLGEQGPFGYREAALIALDASRALSAVHRAGLLHRDIKAENVMREEGGRILLMDFGLSALPQLQTNISGTPNYMAPELWQGQPATVETDIYAMGVLLYVLVAGQPPVRLSGLTARAAAVAIEKRRPLIDVRPDLPGPFLRTVTKAMENDPAKRFSSAGQLAGALSECLGTAAPVDAAVLPRWRKGLGSAVVAAVLILATVGWRSQTARRWVGFKEQAAAAVSSGTYDNYLKAQDLLQHSYNDANLAAAVKIFNGITKDDSAYALAQAGLGAAYFVQYRSSSDAKLLDMAKEATDRALALDKNAAQAYVTQARMLAMQGNTDLAMQLALKAIELNPRSAEAYAARAEVYEAQGKLDDAVAAVQTAIDLAPENSMWLVRLGNYSLSQGKTKDAAEAWQKAVDLDSQNVFALYDLGLVEMQTNKLDEARANFEKVLHIKQDADSYSALATIYELQGRYGDAVTMDRKATVLEPANPQAWGNLGGAYTLSANRSGAVESYRKAIVLSEGQRKISPGDPELLIDLADYYASVHDARSLPLIREALALSPGDPKIAYFAGESYELLGQRAQAVELIAKALGQGYQADLFQRSPEMASLRNDPAFRAALAKAAPEKAVDTTK